MTYVDPIPTEEEDQIELVKYLDAKGIFFTHIPNSTFTKSWSVKRRNTRMGVRPGFPDLVLIINGRIVFLELKRVKGGVLSPFQKNWISQLKECNQEVKVCNGLNEAISYIDSLLNEAKCS